MNPLAISAAAALVAFCAGFWVDNLVMSKRILAADNQRLEAVAAENTRRQIAIDEVLKYGAEQRKILEANYAAAERSRGELQKHRDAYVASVADGSTPAIDAIGVFTELLGELDSRAEVYARTADASRQAGLLCERSFEGMTQRK